MTGLSAHGMPACFILFALQLSHIITSPSNTHLRHRFHCSLSPSASIGARYSIIDNRYVQGTEKATEGAGNEAKNETKGEHNTDGLPKLTSEQLAKLVEMKRANQTWANIGKELGIAKHEARLTFKLLEEKGELEKFDNAQGDKQPEGQTLEEILGMQPKKSLNKNGGTQKATSPAAVEEVASSWRISVKMPNPDGVLSQQEVSSLCLPIQIS